MVNSSSNIIFLDTETTGLENGRIIQLAYKKSGGDMVVEYYKPPVPIEFEAMGIHHITEEMVQDALPFNQTETYKNLSDLLSRSVLVAHNAKFDIGVLEQEGIATGEYICTYKVAYRLYDLPDHKLQSLRYRWGIKIEEARAHDASGDVAVLEQVFEYMLQNYCAEQNKRKEEALHDFIDISKKPVLLRKIGFGKYAGTHFQTLRRDYPDYLVWMKEKMENKSEDLIFTIDYYLSITPSPSEDTPF